ncbi:nuclear pore complex protein Nup85-like isoform X1 [Amphibalanus amphitrite]|uniref:nuclear pore complex protein Nup85-like isoform X1 n=2 Tax=Amphibalanus amphitrite TaxID=1232801 RepID=UPI001C91A510|nr:nuclear pore complex protein Nup85-like isoform X1 [Amphibalanus amphitrite]
MTATKNLIIARYTQVVPVQFSMEDDTTRCDVMVSLPMPTHQRLNINFSHGCQNNVVLHAVDFGAKDTDSGQPGGAQAGGGVREVFWSPSEWPGWWRQLASESAGVFSDLQSCDAGQGEAALRLSLLKLSRRYRSCLRASMETVTASDEEDADTHRQLLNSMEMVWNLSEIVLVDQKRGGVVLGQLLDWVRQHATQFDKSAAAVTEAEIPEKHPDYWNTVYGMVLQGRQAAARKLLRLHSGFGTDPFVSADELLRKVPPLAEGADFELRWRHWQAQCVLRLESGEFGYSPRLQTLVKILCGDAVTFEDLYREMGSWYHLMVSYTLYSRPWVGIFELRHAAEDSIEVFGGPSQLSALDQMLQAALDGDIHKLLKTAQATLPDGWLTAHLADLLCRLPDISGAGRPSFLSELRHHLLVEYGSALCASRSLWQLGAVYLDQCGAQGRARLALLLERLDPRTDRRARKIIQMAESRGLSAVASSVAQVMGRRAMAAGQLGTALAWALRSDCSALASQLADTLVKQYTSSGRFASADFVDNLGSSMLKSDRLMFLGKYREFHRLYEEDSLQEAASLLVTLMTSQLAPKYFWRTLLTDALPLLELQPPAFSTAQTYDLMACVEQLRRSGDLDESSEEVRLLRQALADNLWRASIAEDSVAS